MISNENEATVEHVGKLFPNSRINFSRRIADAKVRGDNFLVLKFFTTIDVVVQLHMTRQRIEIVSLGDMRHLRNENVRAIHVWVLVKSSRRTISQESDAWETLLIRNLNSSLVEFSNFIPREFKVLWSELFPLFPNDVADGRNGVPCFVDGDEELSR